MLRELLHGWFLLGLFAMVVVGLLGHNLAQAYVARLLGDRRAFREGYARPGRIQLEPLGVVCAFLTVGAYGYAGVVPVDARFPRQRPRAAAALLAGPAFLFGATCAAAAASAHVSNVHVFVVFEAASYCGAGLLVTSLIPIPPLALGRALWLFAPATPGWRTAQYRFEEDSVGSLIAFAVLMLPLLWSVLPNVIRDIADPLLRGICDLVHADFLRLLVTNDLFAFSSQSLAGT